MIADWDDEEPTVRIDPLITVLRNLLLAFPELATSYCTAEQRLIYERARQEAGL